MQVSARQNVLISVILALTALLDDPKVKDRVDCHPDPGASESRCLNRGCIYHETTEPGAPWCFYPPEFGYHLHGEVQETEKGFRAELVKSGSPSFAPDEFNFIILEAEFQTKERLRIKIHPNTSRYEVPIKIEAAETKPKNPLYELHFSQDPVFSFKVKRRSTGTVLFDSALGGLTLADQFLQIGTKLPSWNVYGIGEQKHLSLRHNLTWRTLGMFANDRPPTGEVAVYGVHPKYTVLEDDGNAHSVLFLNSNAQEISMTPAPGLIYRTIGGILDIYFFLGPYPEETVQQYTAAIGKHPLPAYWSLGFHLCRYGYSNLENMIAAYNRTKKAGIPLDAQWGDIDVFDRRLDFTYNQNNFTKLPQFIDELHKNGQKFVTIVDPAIATGEPNGTYIPYEDGNANQVWVVDSKGKPVLGRVWPDYPTVFPDFSKESTIAWWTRSIRDWRKKVKFDGLWIDMNEPSSFVTGSIDGCEQNKYTKPPYIPKIGRDNLNDKTLCMDAVHKAGLHYDVHSMYGWFEAIATRKALAETLGQRSIIISRSTFVGSGHYAGHWLGDNQARWDNMKSSIVGMIEFNEFGIPLVGADICGFGGDTTEELCARWHLLGAFYPFSRNHNAIGARDQDPAVWPSVAKNAKFALEIRYRLLPHLYTLFYLHSLLGTTVVRPLWHEFPKDPNAPVIDEQFLWGRSFMVAPAIHEGQDKVSVYFPEARWFDYHTRMPVNVSKETLTVDCPLDCIPLYVRGGAIIPAQNPGTTTLQSRQNDYNLLVVLNDKGTAVGQLFMDDGISIDERLTHGSLLKYHVLFNATRQAYTLYSSVLTRNYDTQVSVSKIEVWGLCAKLTKAVVIVGEKSSKKHCSVKHFMAEQDSNLTAEIFCGDALKILADWTLELRSK